MFMLNKQIKPFQSGETSFADMQKYLLYNCMILNVQSLLEIGLHRINLLKGVGNRNITPDGVQTLVAAVKRPETGPKRQRSGQPGETQLPEEAGEEEGRALCLKRQLTAQGENRFKAEL